MSTTKKKVIPQSSFNVKWFKDQLKRCNGGKGISQRAAADKLEMHQASISQMFAGTRKMQPDEVSRWAELFNCSIEDVMLNAGIPTAGRASPAPGRASFASVKIIGWADGQLQVHDAEGLKGSKAAPNPGTTSPSLRCVRCQTSGSEFEGMDGALLYYDETSSVDPEALGRLCVVRVNGQDHDLIRVIKRGYESGKHNLAMPNNKPTEENVLIKYASPILWMKL